jgi:DegV family protein with EDD domain
MEHAKVAVVTDSTAYIPPEALGDLDIPIIPVWMIWDGDSFRDGVDIDPPTFYKRLRTSKTFPTTSQPSAGEFEAFFRDVGSRADAIVGIYVTGRLSGTVDNAQAAAQRLSDLTIRVIDSGATSMAQGFVVLAAARAAAAGKSLDEVVAVAEDMRDRAHLIVALDTLDWLHRGGRVGNAKWLVGRVLNIKPLLHFEDGTLQPLAQVRSKSKAVDRVLDLTEQQLAGQPMAEAAVIDVDSPAEADELMERVATRFAISPVYRTTVSPAIGVHAGPGAVGLCFYAER